ncbi:MAG TPA: ribbon-helix-helix protein, CopG family [Tepidiformaceae bacterium]|nr:ribbon-helix-helix protein, CopG family [Tepidiformaceae bacterium]
MVDLSRRVPPPPPPAALVTVRLSQPRKAKLDALAEARGIRQSEVLRALIDDAYDRMEAERAR